MFYSEIEAFFGIIWVLVVFIEALRHSWIKVASGRKKQHMQDFKSKRHQIKAFVTQFGIHIDCMQPEIRFGLKSVLLTGNPYMLVIDLVKVALDIR